MSKAQDMLCTALELAERGIQVYRKAADICPDAIGTDVYKMLEEDEKRLKSRIEETYAAVKEGEAFEQACVLPAEEDRDVRKIVASLVEEHNVGKGCDTNTKALELGVDFENAWIHFFSEEMAWTTGGKDAEFIQRMIQEGREHKELLNDLQYFYDDPKGWAMGTHKPRLDGA